MKRFFSYILALAALVLTYGCSKSYIEQSQVSGTYTIEYKFPDITLELNKGKCSHLTLGTQNNMSLETSDVKTNGRYPSMSYSCNVEGKAGEVGGFCEVTASFISPERFEANIKYYVTNNEDGDDQIVWAGESERVVFIRVSE